MNSYEEKEFFNLIFGEKDRIEGKLIGARNLVEYYFTFDSPNNIIFVYMNTISGSVIYIGSKTIMIQFNNLNSDVININFIKV